MSSLGKYLPGKIWAVAGMAVMAQRAGIGAGPATGSAVILQLLAIGTGVAVVGLTGWGALRAAYPGATAGLVILLAGSVGRLALLLWPPLVSRLLRLGAPEAGRRCGRRPRRWRSAWWRTRSRGWATASPSGCWRAACCRPPGLDLLPAIAVFTASYLAGFLALFAPGGIGVREGVFILMLQGPIGIGAATALAIASRLLLTVTELGAAVPFLLFPAQESACRRLTNAQNQLEPRHAKSLALAVFVLAAPDAVLAHARRAVGCWATTSTWRATASGCSAPRCSARPASIPQWNPYLLGGLPYIAAQHGDIFYPTAWLRWVLPVDLAMSLGFAIHLVIAGFTMYLLLRALRVVLGGRGHRRAGLRADRHRRLAGEAGPRREALRLGARSAGVPRAAPRDS